MTAGSQNQIYFWKHWEDFDDIKKSSHKTISLYSNGVNKITSDECLFVSCSEKRIKISSFLTFEESVSHKRSKLESRMSEMKKKMGKEKKKKK